MKIGFLLPSLLMGEKFARRIFAPKNLALSLIEKLVEKGHQVYLYSASGVQTKGILVSGDKTLEENLLPSVRIRYEERKFLEEIFFRINYAEYEAYLTMKAFLHAKKNGLDVLHSYHDFLAHYFSPLCPEIPVVYTLHDPPYSPGTLEGWRYSQFPSDFYVAISFHQAKSYQSSGIKILTVIYHGIEVKKAPFSFGDKGYLAFIGRLIPEKGVVAAIEVAKKLKIPLEIATSENYFPTPYFQEVVRPILTPEIKIREYMSGEELFHWLGGAKALLFPINWDEPFGLVMVEAQACGTPVIAYARGSVPEIVKDGETGFLVSPFKDASSPFLIKETDLEGLISAVKKLNSLSPKEYQTMRLSCRQHVEKNFSLEKMVENYEKVYREIVKRKR